MTPIATIADADREILRIRPTGKPVMYQSWQDLLFLHWEIPVDALQALLPPGLTVDLHQGRAYVGLVPFTMRNVRPAGFPTVRGLSNFHETNVRTYVHHEGREPGVWFFSLDAANVVGATLGRKWFALPYFFAAMSLKVHDSDEVRRLSYQSRRIYPNPRPATTRIKTEVHAPIEPAPEGSLEYFLAERYLLYSASKRGDLFKGRVHHTPYPLQIAELLELEESVLKAARIDRPETKPIAHYARGVDVEVFGLERVATI